jgi:hypothetical protein
MANTISTKTWRDKYRLSSLDKLLRQALVAEVICDVDRSGSKTIQNPYGSQPTVTVQALAGTYSVNTFTTTDDTLTVATEFIVAEHVYDFEDVMSKFDLFANRTDEQNFAVAAAIDKYVLNTLVANAGQTAVAASMGATNGFSTPANLPIIVSNLLSLVAGYADMYKGTYLVLEAGDLVGVLQQEIASGFSFSDSALNNGFVTSYMGVDLYVVRPSTFATYSPGSDVFTNQGKRLFGVKKTCTYAHPQGIRFEEKGVTGKTGKEVVTFGYIGAKVWATKANLTIALTNVGASPSSSLSPSKSPSLSPSKSPSVSPS